MSNSIKAISIRQPYPWAIFHAGKDIENRDWNDRHPSLYMARQLLGKRILIHAGKGMTRDGYEDFVDTARHVAHVLGRPLGVTLPPMKDLPRGGIVGSAVLAHIVTNHTSPWFFGRIGLVLRDAKPLPFRAMNGQLGFFDVPGEALDE